MYRVRSKSKSVRWLYLIIVTGLVLHIITGCSTYKEIPIKTEVKTEVKDSLIYLKDTVTVEVPVEKIVTVLPQLDTSYLSTSLANSTAYLDVEKQQLHHTLEQKGELEIQYDTVVSIEYINRFIEKEVPVEVIKEVKYLPTIFWLSVIFNILVIVFIGVRMYLKSKLG